MWSRKRASPAMRAGAPADRAAADAALQALDRFGDVLPFGFGRELEMIDPAPAVAANVVILLADRRGELAMALDRQGAGVECQRQAVLLEQAQHAPDADSAAVFEHRLCGEVAVAPRHIGGIELGHRHFGETVAVTDRIFGSFFDVENEIYRNAGAVRPLWMRHMFTVSDDISLSIGSHQVVSWVATYSAWLTPGAERRGSTSRPSLVRLIGRPRPGFPKTCPRSQMHSPPEKVMTGRPRIACPS